MKTLRIFALASVLSITLFSCADETIAPVHAGRVVSESELLQLQLDSLDQAIDPTAAKNSSGGPVNPGEGDNTPPPVNPGEGDNTPPPVNPNEGDGN